MGVAYLAAYIDLQQPIVGVVAESSSDRSINTDGVNTVGNEVEGYLAAILVFTKVISATPRNCLTLVCPKSRVSL